MNTSFDIFWDTFDNKKSREKVERKWYSMSVTDQQACMDSLPSYIKSTPDRAFRKHPSTYLNQKCWEDTIYSKDEQTQTYKEPTQPTVSTYETKPFDRATGIQHLRDKLKANYENGTPIKDWGDVYTTILREFIEIPGEVGVRLHEAEVTEASKKRKRSEPQYIGSVTANVRDARLNWQLDFWRKEKRNISLEI